MITITLNERAIDVEDHFNVLQLLHEIKSPVNGIAVAINNQIIPQDTWETVKLKSNDQLLIIQATQGG